MVIDFAQQLPVDCRKNISFFLKTARRIFFCRMVLRVIILNPYFSFMQLPNKKNLLHPISILAHQWSFPENKIHGMARRN
jgi:hypothetical protein